MEELEKFLQVSDDGDGSGSGSGYGNGNGRGYGYGYGNGNCSSIGSGNGFSSGSGFSFGNSYRFGYGYGEGFGEGNGDGSGSGYGYGDDIIEINGERVYQIDDIPTLIDKVHSNYAKGRILNDDFTFTPTFIAKVGNYFAHGRTLRKARADAQEKYNENRPLSERIAAFRAEFPDFKKSVDAQKLFDWHHILTGSCLQGRKEFCRNNGIDLNSQYTVNEFIELTENEYGGDIIKMLKLQTKQNE